ncbi:MAG: hypothetical protein JWO05_3666 [Gemmatimonadetes bacterium]|nr:hypothetical protein [Gemmatimonadota bacterium]
MSLHRPSSLVALATVIVLAAACGSDSTSPVATQNGDKIAFTSAQVSSLDSSGGVIVASNPGDPTLRALLDSTLMVFKAGVEAQKVAVTTNVTTAPLYFAGIHRVVSRASGSFSTWNVVGMDDPAKLTSLVEVSGFASSTNATAPTSVSGTIGDGTGVVNALFLNVTQAGIVTRWNANTGTVSITSDAPTGTCPAGMSTANTACSIEVMHLHFTANAASGSNGAGARSAVVPSDVSIPTIRLTYTGP